MMALIQQEHVPVFLMTLIQQDHVHVFYNDIETTGTCTGNI